MTVTASIDKNPVVVNESFVLTVVADDDVDTNALDTTPLMQNFVVGRTSVSSQTSMINFKTTRSTKWSTVLIARKAGKIIIPPLHVADQQTQPIELTVLTSNDPQASKQQDIFITSEVSAKQVYVQQQLTLTVKLHFAAELKRGSLTEPELEDANITQVGKDKESDTIINGRRYRVIERTYAISPQQSGQYTLKSPVFSGEIMLPSSRRNSFLSFGETKPVSVIGEEIPIDIRPIPANYQGVWLPSELLSIHQEWQPSVEQFKVGEPITRIITLTAAGLSEEQLPEINMLMPDGLKVYPDQAELHTGMNSGRLVSQKVRNFAIVANKPGTYQLPEITIPWWNTVSNKIEYATIAAQTINVSANKDFANVQPATSSAQEQTRPEAVPEKIIVTQTSWLQWLFFALWLLTSLAWLATALAKKRSTNKLKSEHHQTNKSYLALMAACKKNNAQQALQLIIPWYNSISQQQVATLSQVMQSAQSAELSEAITSLQQSCYSQQNEAWQGQQLLTAITELNKKQNSKRNTPVHFTLNP
ncbi:BatD family protein [Thalassotalea sp. G2M2-11]|uniref:BatD family protein n=1 Tax=Thalassotalea sp. G2M2-11 TaxID=2787627 RepID=UPI0019CFDC61|nr:BatD family protein [Thalassotalea sp. G2M2-11]